MKRFRDTDLCKFLIAMLELALIIAAVYLIVCAYRGLGFADAIADELPENVTEAYVICTPDDYVNVRNRPNKNGECIGRFDPGDRILLDGKRRDGYLHCVGLSFEETEGWIHSGFIVYDEPKRTDAEYTVVAKKRLAARKHVGGKRTRWLKPMEIITVYYWSEEWCVTNKGYVRTEWLEYGGY